jgi:3'(2'), 5'-bisphosphate nucleotidase
MSPSQDPVLEKLVRIAAEAAVVVAEVYAAPFSVEYKGPEDPVTAADHRANALICRRLTEEFPGVPVVAEESPEAEWATFRDFDRIFFVDPVDGTREFVARNGEFAVMIGMVEGNVATRGVIHAPAQGLAWAGSLGHGAFEIDAQGARRSLTVGGVTDIAEARVVASRSHRGRLLEQSLEHLAAREVVHLGSAGLKGVAIARQVADIYLVPRKAGSLWDACAPDAIVSAAGGVFTDARGLRIDYRSGQLENDRGVIAANPELHGKVAAHMSTFLSGALGSA